MRAIDADKVKAITREECKDCIMNGSVYCKRECFTNRVCDYIDNAPTVEAVDFERHAKLIKQAYQKGKDIRPQGEWIIDGHHRRCNYCNEYTCIEDREGNSIPDNFCPNCGAEMKGGAE